MRLTQQVPLHDSRKQLRHLLHVRNVQKSIAELLFDRAAGCADSSSDHRHAVFLGLLNDFLQRISAIGRAAVCRNDQQLVCLRNLLLMFDKEVIEV